MRPTRFELHIIPMIRELDRQHMEQFRNIDLWNYQTVSSASTAAKILRAIKAQPADVMPPESYGGPWPEEWVQLFQRWVTEGCHRLGRGAANQFTAQRSGPTVTVTADGAALGQSTTVWLDRYLGPEGADLVLFQDDVGQPGLGQSYPVTDFFAIPTALTHLNILDAAGLHAVPIT